MPLYNDNYLSSAVHHQIQHEKLGRIALKIMHTVEEHHQEAFSRLMKEKDIKEWWGKYKEAEQKDRQKREEELSKRKEKDAIKAAALEKLSEEEKRVFGLIPQSRKKK
jgi:hypothetical protein